MKQSKPRQLLSTKINAGVKAAVAAAIERHRKLGESIAVWQDGKVVILTADRISPISAEK
jgi:transcriptional antiterminator Rof (Rho-off)